MKMFFKKINDKNRDFSTLELVCFVIISLLIGISIGCLFTKTNVITKKEVVSNENIKDLIESYEFIINNYYDAVDEKKLVTSAVDGMMKSLDDPHSLYIDENSSDNFSISLNGEYEGIGIQVIYREDTKQIIVDSILKDSPAERENIKPGDQLLKINNQSLEDYDAKKVSELIKNNQDRKIEIELLSGDKKRVVSLQKEKISLISVDSKIYDKEKVKIGYIYIGIFANNTYEQFKNELKKLESKNIDALIIDVRANTGGHLTSVDNILDLFLNKDQKMYGFEKNGKKTYTYATGEENKKYEIVLLGDENSASASEVLISGLRENLYSKFIGKKTYGKGTVQELVTLSDGTQYKLTVKKWLTPSGNYINDTKGLTPDYEIDLDEIYYETQEDKDDTQLNYAIEYLQNKLTKKQDK